MVINIDEGPAGKLPGTPSQAGQVRTVEYDEYIERLIQAYWPAWHPHP